MKHLIVLTSIILQLRKLLRVNQYYKLDTHDLETGLYRIVGAYDKLKVNRNNTFYFHRYLIFILRTIINILYIR